MELEEPVNIADSFGTSILTWIDLTNSSRTYSKKNFIAKQWTISSSELTWQCCEFVVIQNLIWCILYIIWIINEKNDRRFITFMTFWVSLALPLEECHTGSHYLRLNKCKVTKFLMPSATIWHVLRRLIVPITGEGQAEELIWFIFKHNILHNILSLSLRVVIELF